MQKLLRPKIVFWLEWLRAFIGIVAFLIAFPTCYLAHIFWKSVLTTTKTVIRSGVNQIYTSGEDTSYCMTQLSVTTITLNFTRVSTESLGTCF